jgi:hypothetical protein
MSEGARLFWGIATLVGLVLMVIPATLYIGCGVAVFAGLVMWAWEG